MRDKKTLVEENIAFMIKHAHYLAQAKGTVYEDRQALLEAAPRMAASFAKIQALIDAIADPGWQNDTYAALDDLVDFVGMVNRYGNSNASGMNQIRLEKERSKILGRKAVQLDASAASAARSYKTKRREYIRSHAATHGIDLTKRKPALHVLAPAVKAAGYTCSDETLKADLRSLQPRSKNV